MNSDEEKTEKGIELDEEKEFSRPLGDAVKRARTELRLTQNQVAEQTGIDQRTILNIENYRGNPKLESLYPLVRFYVIDPREIFYPEETLNDPTREKLRFLLDSCSEKEAAVLIPIIRAVLDALRSHGKTLTDNT